MPSDSRTGSTGAATCDSSPGTAPRSTSRRMGSSCARFMSGDPTSVVGSSEARAHAAATSQPNRSSRPRRSFRSARNVAPSSSWGGLGPARTLRRRLDRGWDRRTHRHRSPATIAGAEAKPIGCTNLSSGTRPRTNACLCRSGHANARGCRGDGDGSRLRYGRRSIRRAQLVHLAFVRHGSRSTALWNLVGATIER